MTTTTLSTMNWTQVGAPLVSDKQGLVLEAIEALEWQDLTKDDTLPMMPGLAIKAAIKELRLPKVRYVAVSHRFAPYGFYAIQADGYKGGPVRCYLMDEGSSVVVVASHQIAKVSQ